MYISGRDSFERNFKKWSDTHPWPSNDNPSDAVVADALVKPREAPRDPWLVPGLRNTL